MLIKRDSLILPMMMYGVFKAQIPKLDAQGEKLRDKKGKIQYAWKNKRYTPENSNGIFPSVNHMYVNVGKGGKRLAAGAENLKDSWFTLAKMWANDHNWELKKNEKIIIEMTPYFPLDNIKRDASNAFKLLMDALEDVIYENDFYGLPRTMDLEKVSEGEQPYFKIDIYTKDEEYDILYDRLQKEKSDIEGLRDSSGSDLHLPDDRRVYVTN